MQFACNFKRSGMANLKSIDLYVCVCVPSNLCGQLSFFFFVVFCFYYFNESRACVLFSVHFLSSDFHSYL